MGRTRPPDARVRRPLESLARFGIGASRRLLRCVGRGRPHPARLVRRTGPAHARPLQFLPLALRCRPHPGSKVRHLQARRRQSGQHLFPSYGRRAFLPRPARLRHHLLHVLQHALRFLPERRHQHRQGQRHGHRRPWLGGDGLAAAYGGMPQHKLGGRRPDHPPAHHRRRHPAFGRRPRLHRRGRPAQGASRQGRRPDGGQPVPRGRFLRRSLQRVRCCGTATFS